jgi:hypothetical protein
VCVETIPCNSLIYLYLETECRNKPVQVSLVCTLQASSEASLSFRGQVIGRISNLALGCDPDLMDCMRTKI